MTQTDWERYWQGRQSDASGALTGVEHDQALQKFWQQSLRSLDADRALADFACGAGTVLKTAHQLGFTHLTGIDVSRSALETLQRALPDVGICQSSVDAVPLPDQHFDILVSQFGLEYAGAHAACQEAQRLLTPGGTFLAVMHMAGGAIHQEVYGRLKIAQQIQESQFIALSIDLFEAVYQGDDEGVQAAAFRLQPARDALTQLVEPGQQTFASHLIQSAAQLWQRRAHYRFEDMKDWFMGMDQELQAFCGRMQSMLDACQTQNDLQALSAIFTDRGLHMAPVSALDLGGAPAAWILRTA